MGLGLDGDGHARVTRGEDFLLVGGPDDTHRRMQDGVERMQDTLRKMGTTFQQATHDQVAEAAHESGFTE
jgi:hypothetical protein